MTWNVIGINYHHVKKYYRLYCKEKGTKKTKGKDDVDDVMKTYVYEHRFEHRNFL